MEEYIYGDLPTAKCRQSHKCPGSFVIIRKERVMIEMELKVGGGILEPAQLAAGECAV